MDFTQEELDAEFRDMHMAAYYGPEIIGCLVLSPLEEGAIRMRQVAVSDKWRGQGIGTGLVLASEKLARDRGWRLIVLNARDPAVHFYENLGYEVVGEPFEEIGIPHRAMRKFL